MGQPVRMTATGLINEVTGAADEFVGVFQGVDYTPVGGRPVKGNFWPGGTSATDITVYYTDDPAILYEIQSDGIINFANSIGGGVNFSNFAAGSTLTGQAATTCTAAVAAAGTSQLRIVDLGTNIGTGGTTNDWGDNFVIVRCLIGLHQYTGNKAVI
jgi:hypothetical protein